MDNMALRRDNMKEIHSAASDTIDRIISWVTALPSLDATELDEHRTVFFVIDAINGFAAPGGTLYDRRVEQVMPNIAELLDRFPDSERYFFCDAHSASSPEFDSYPAHALEDSWESQVVGELLRFTSEENIVRKNSTNAMVTSIRDGNRMWPFLEYLRGRYLGVVDLPVFVIVGDVTDICVLQAALTLKAYLNEWYAPARVILPADCVETFDLEATNHDGDIMNLFALYNMNMNGIEVVASIK
jgi:nicotinamidase-related amidase